MANYCHPFQLSQLKYSFFTRLIANQKLFFHTCCSFYFFSFPFSTVNKTMGVLVWSIISYVNILAIALLHECNCSKLWLKFNKINSQFFYPKPWSFSGFFSFGGLIDSSTFTKKKKNLQDWVVTMVYIELLI